MTSLYKSKLVAPERAINRGDAVADRPGARPGGPGVPARGTADAGAVVRGPHPARLLRRRVPGARAGPRVARPPRGDPLLIDARPALVEGDDRAVRRRRRDRDDPERSSSACCGRSSWPRTATSSASRFALEGFSFFVEAIFIAHLRLRLGPAVAARAHADRHPGRDRRLHRLADGDRGQRLDEPPDRLPARERPARSTSSRSTRCSATRTSGTRSCTCTSPAYIVAGFVTAASTRSAAARPRRTATCAWRWRPAGRGRARRAGAGRRRRLGGARGRRASSRSSSPRSRGSADTERARRSTSAAGTTRRTRSRYGIAIPRLLSLLAFHDPNATVQGLDTRAARGPAAGQRRARRLLHDGRRSAPCSRPSASGLAVRAGGGAGALPRARWFYRALVAALGPLSVVALIAGWVTTEVGRQPWVVYGACAPRRR